MEIIGVIMSLFGSLFLREYKEYSLAPYYLSSYTTSGYLRKKSVQNFNYW